MKYCPEAPRTREVLPGSLGVVIAVLLCSLLFVLANSSRSRRSACRINWFEMGMPASRAASSSTAAASSRLSLSGFSQSTCLPAATNPSTISRCRKLATATLTTLMSGSSAIACQDVSERSYPKRRAATEPRWGLTSPMATNRSSGKVGWYSVGAVR